MSTYDPMQGMVGRTVAFHNPSHNRFMKLISTGGAVSPVMDAGKMPDSWQAERFEVVPWPSWSFCTIFLFFMQF